MVEQVVRISFVHGLTHVVVQMVEMVVEEGISFYVVIAMYGLYSSYVSIDTYVRVMECLEAKVEVLESVEEIGLWKYH